MKKYLFLIVLFTPIFTGFSAPQNEVDTNCPAPSNVTVTGEGTGSISFDWADCGCVANGYLVSYRRQADGYVSQDYGTSVSAHTFNGLPAGTYDFFFRTDCGAEESGTIVIEDRIVL